MMIDHPALLIKLLKIASLLIFLWQSFISISHYIDDPTGTTIEQLTLADVNTLRIVACDMDQFSVDKSHEFGYIWKSSFLKGELDNQQNLISWKGMNNNETYDKILEEMYKPNYESMEPYYGAHYQNTTTTIFPYGKCLLIKNYSNPLMIRTKRSIEIFLTDIYQDTYFSLALKAYTGEKIKIDLAHGVTSELATYNIKLKKYQQLEYKDDCHVYESAQAYKQCLVSEYQRVFKACVPKWLDNQTSCEKITVTEDMKDYKNKLANLTIHLTGGDSLTVPGCKPHCMKTMIESNQLVYRYNLGGDTSFIQLYFDHSVEKIMEIPKYSVFTVLVDIGSALGFWLGLSALDLLDGFVDGTKLFVGKACYKQKK